MVEFLAPSQVWSMKHFVHTAIFLCPKVTLCLFHTLPCYLVAMDLPHLFWRVTQVCGSVSLLSLLPAGADQGMPRTSLPAGMAASLFLMNSKQDICSHHTGADALNWLQGNVVNSPCCDARCITHLNSKVPLKRTFFYPSAKQTEWKLVC